MRLVLEFAADNPDHGLRYEYLLEVQTSFKDRPRQCAPPPPAVVQNQAVSEAPRAPVAPVTDARAATPRLAPGQTLEVSKVADNLPFVLRTFVGISALGVGANVIGVIVLTLIVGAINSSVTDHQQHVVLAASAIVLVALVVLGVSSATFIQRRTLRWLLRGERPSLEDARRALRMPRDMAVIAAVLWTVGAASIAPVLALSAIDARTVVTVTGSIIVAGLSSAGVTYLLIGRVSHPVALLALESCPPQNAPVFGVRWRLLLIWVLTSGLPVIGLVLILTGPHGKRHVVGASIVVACIALAVGGLSTGLAARAIGAPLRTLVVAFREVAEGHLDASVVIEDGGEIGLVQSGFNEMVAGLRERDRVKDLFGRHVGSSVAQEALRSGVTLSGEVREVVTVFVDITGSTKLSRETDPRDFVAMLNRFYEIVVDEVERNGGLLNKFEGDAALCIFGAPVELIDPASSALRAARRIRDRVFATSEVEVGVGVAAGPVVAGQVGTQSRLEFTVIGDAVNEAARLTDLAKKVRQHLLASSEAIERASDRERAEWDEVGSVVLRGREVPTRIWTA